MDDLSSKEITDHSTQQINEFITKLQSLSNFTGFDNSIFEQIRDDFVQLPSYLIKKASRRLTNFVMSITIEFIRYLGSQPGDPEKIQYLRNLLSLLSLMGYKTSRMDIRNIDEIFSIFSAFIRKCDHSLLPIVLHVFYHILDDSDPESEQVRQKFLKYFIPSFAFCIQSFIPKFETNMDLYETAFFIQVIEFLLKLTVITYSEISFEVDQLLSTLYKFLQISPKETDSIQNVNNILLLQSKIIKIFITYHQLKLPIQNFKAEMVIPNLLNILKHVDTSYFYTVRDILFNLILIMKLQHDYSQHYGHLLANLPLFCQFSKYDPNVIDPYTILITEIYEKSFNLKLIVDQNRVHLFLYMMNILHYQGVRSFIRHNEFDQLHKKIPIKGYILFLYNYSFDVDFIKSIRNLSKYYLPKYDIDTLFESYDKSSNVGKSIMKIFKILTSNLKIIFDRYRSNSSSLLCEVTSKYNICNTKLLIMTLCDAMFFAVNFHHLLNHLSTIIPEVSKETPINEFYEIERKMIALSTIAEASEKIYSLLLSELLNIFSIIPMNFVCNILDIFLKKLFDQDKITIEKSFIAVFTQNSSTLIPFIDSFFSFIIPQFQTYKNIHYLFSVSLQFFQAINDLEINIHITGPYQDLIQNHAMRLIYILKEDYIISIPHSSDALKLISNLIKFINKLFEKREFSIELINNNNFIRDICKCFQYISIPPTDSIEFIDFCSSISDKSLTLPYVLEILISSLEKSPNLAIPLLNKAKKINKKAVYQHPMADLLFQTSAYLLDKINNPENKKILLKFLKHSTPDAITNINRIPDDISSLKKLVFRNDEANVEFYVSLPQFIDKLKVTIVQSPKNEMLYSLICDTILSIFATKDLSYENRKAVMSLLSFLFSFYEKEEYFVDKCFKRILSLTENNYIVYAHIFVALCSNFQEPPTKFIVSILTIIKSLSDFGSFVNEILVISYFNLLPSKSVMKLVIKSFIQNIISDLIDPVSLALLGYEYLSSSTISFGTKNEYKDDNLTTFSELGYLAREQIDIIIFIRDLLGKSSSSLAPILNLIPSLSVFPQIILFEFMSRCKCTKEVLSFFEKCINAIPLDGALYARLVGLTLRAFPEIVTLKSDQILDLLSTLETSYLSTASNSTSSPPSTNWSPSSSMTSLPSLFSSSSITTFSSGSIERQQEGNILLILNVLLSTNPELVNNGSNYFSSVVRFLTSNNLFYRHQARIGIKNFFEIKNNEIDLMINIAHKEYMHSINFPEDIYDSTFIDFSACYEYLMIFFPIYHNTIFSTIISYLKHIENSFVVNPNENYLKKPEKHQINQDIFIKSLLSLFSFFSNASIIKILSEKGYMIQLLPYIAFVYCTFIFQRNRIFDDYILKMLEKAPSQFIEYLNTSSSHPHCLDFFVIFLENEKAFQIMKKHEDEIKLNSNINSDQKLPNNYYLSLTTILTNFGIDSEKNQQNLINYIDAHKSDLRHYEPFLFSKIMNKYAKTLPDFYLIIIFHIIKADSPLLLAHCKSIFIENVEKFKEKMFDDLPYNQYNDCVNESFFNNIICRFIIANPESTDHFIQFSKNTQSAYVVASFYLALYKKKIISEANCDVDALELYNKSDNDKARLKALMFWSKFSKCSDFNKMFQNLQSYISLYSPSEVFDCLWNLKTPENFVLPSSFFNIIPVFYNQESTYSALLSIVSRNDEQINLMPMYLKQDLLMNLEFSFDSPNSRITDSISLFDSAFDMIKSKEDETLIRRCEGYISKTIQIVKIYPSSSRTFLKLMLQNAFKIIKLIKEEEENEESSNDNDNEEMTENSLLFEELTKFFDYMLENQRNAPAIQALACFLPDLTEILVENEDEASAENLLSQVVDLKNHAFWPYVMKALNVISSFNNIYERIVGFRDSSLISHSLPIIWDSPKEKTYKQIDITMNFCSLKLDSRIDILLQNICMIYMTRNLKSSNPVYLLKNISNRVKFIDDDENKNAICKVLEFGIKSENQQFVTELLKLFDSKKILDIYFNKNSDKIDEELISQLSPIALLNGWNYYMNKYPSYITKIFSGLPKNYFVRLSELFSSIFNAKPEEALGLINNLGLKIKIKKTSNDTITEPEPEPETVETNLNIDESQSKKNEDEEEEENKDEEEDKQEENKDEEEDKKEEEEDKKEEEEDKKENNNNNSNVLVPENFITPDNLDFLFTEQANFNFDTSEITLKTSFECLENLSNWEISNLKKEPEFSCSFSKEIPSFLLYSHFSMKEKAQESIVDILDNPEVSFEQVRSIINEPNYDALLNFVTENISEPDTVLQELTNFLDKMQSILNEHNFLDYLIIHTLKCPIEMISNGSITFPPHAFELKLSPATLPKYHNLYSKVRDTFMIFFAKYRKNAKSESSGISMSENKSLQNLNNKFKSIHEKHKIAERLSLANFEGNEMGFNTQERDIERIITAVFSSPLSNDSNDVVEEVLLTLEKGLKLNPSNDIFLTVLATKHDQIDSEKLENLLNLIKTVPLKWSPFFINLIIKDDDKVNNEDDEEEEDEYESFNSLLPKIHKGFYISLVENKVDVSLDTKKLVNSYLLPLHRAIKSFKSTQLLKKSSIEKDLFRILRKKNYNKKSIPSEIMMVVNDITKRMNDDQKTKDEENKENEKEEEEDLLNNNDSSSSTFFISSHLPSVPPPLVDENNSAIYMACYMKKCSDKFITVTMSLNNGYNVNYILAPIKVSQSFSLLCSLLSNILKTDQQCCLQGQIIEGMSSVKLGNDFTLINAKDAEPLYDYFLIKELYEGGRKHIAEDMKPKIKNRNKTDEVVISPCKNDFFYNFSKKESFIKWFYHFGTKYAAISIIQTLLSIPTPSPAEVFINPKTASTLFSTIDSDFLINNSKFSNVRMCGKMRKFCSRFVLNGPFRDGLISASTCFVVNQHKTSLILDSIFDDSNRRDSLTFIKRCSYFSYHHSDPTVIESSVNQLIEKSYNDTKTFVIPWL